MSQGGQPEITTTPWTESRLLALISDEIEENASLEYKRAAALDRRDPKKKIEITKDVSAFANSTGGTLIYGVAEGEGEEEHIPVRIDPVDRNQYSKEWLEQIISGIHPPIDGLKIHSVQVKSPYEGVCYVVEIPESVTAHQATDWRYYKRGNFIAEPMRDYEVRLVMNRIRHPSLELRVELLRSQNFQEWGFTVLAHIRNTGPRIAKQYMLNVAVPARINACEYAPDDDRADLGDDGFWRVMLPTSINPKPIFPSSTKTISLKVLQVQRLTPTPRPVADQRIVCHLYADEMPFIEVRTELGF